MESNKNVCRGCMVESSFQIEIHINMNLDVDVVVLLLLRVVKFESTWHRAARG